MVPRLLCTERIMRALTLLIALGACAESASTTPPDPDPDPVSPTAVFLSPAQHLTRASMALRGTRPSVEDLRAVEADPKLIPSIVDGYLASAAFGLTLKEMHNEKMHVRVVQTQ